MTHAALSLRTWPRLQAGLLVVAMIFYCGLTAAGQCRWSQQAAAVGTLLLILLLGPVGLSG